MTTARGSLLVVDDDEENREMLARFLQAIGYNVTLAEDANRALELIGKQAFELILLDIMMAGMGGLEVLRIIRQTHPATKLPVIMATAKTGSEDVVEALKLGANDYVTKPFDYPVLLARVETHLSLKRAVEERDYLRAREIEVAKQVQSRMLPQQAPPLETLEYVGKCIQARSVGGDYYDFLDLGPGQLGVVLADICGKGISAALLMANLQADVRSQHTLAVNHLPRLLQSVNHLFYESSNPTHYASFFFGNYKDATRRLCYANCGHNPPLLLRANGAVEQLEATATVLGMFEQWDCSIDEVALASGDILLIFSDGVTEAMSDEGVQYGDERLLDTLRANRHLPVSALLTAIVDAVRRFSGPEQADDQTLLLARAR
jgi:serine phosphatase RsbU (regulator of sigma subunit)